GWDQEQRAAAVQHFGLDAAELEDRHAESSPMLEQGRMTLDEYLRCTVFYHPRSFKLEEFRAYMLTLSVPFPETINLARGLARTGGLPLHDDQQGVGRAEPAPPRAVRIARHLHHLFLLVLGGCHEARPPDLRGSAGDVAGGARAIGVHRRPRSQSDAGARPRH